MASLRQLLKWLVLSENTKYEDAGLASVLEKICKIMSR